MPPARLTHMRALQDIKYALRFFRRSPGVAAIAFFSIAISTGVTAVVFAAVKTVLIQPLPFRDPQELIQLRSDQSSATASRADWVSWNDMQDVAQRTRTLSSIGIYHYAIRNLAGDRTSLPESLYGLTVSSNLFPLLGVTPMLGRNVLPSETQPGNDNELILSYRVWADRFNSDPNILGRHIEANGVDSTIVGVMPAGFDFPMRMATTVRTPSQHMDFWAPLAVDPAKANRAVRGYGAVARLRPGATLEQARQDLASIGGALAREYPSSNRDRVFHASYLRDKTIGSAGAGLWLLMAASTLFMLIGCANVANLLLARALARRREISIRFAVGAGRMAILRQLVTEGCVLAFVGGLGGYGLAALAWTILPALAPMTIPRLAAARTDDVVLVFVICVAMVNGILFGIAPALQSQRRDLSLALREPGANPLSGAARNRLRFSLVAGEVAISVVLAVIGSILTGSFRQILGTDPGFEPDRVLASIVIPAGNQYKDPARRTALFQRILDSVRAMPGVEVAGVVDALPFSGQNSGAPVSSDDLAGRAPELIAEVDRVSADYLRAMGVRLLQGRSFREEDEAASRDTAIVSASAAARLWPGQSAVGKRICVDCEEGAPPDWKRVIGVVENVRHASLEEPVGAQIYLSGDALAAAQFLVVRANRPSADLAKALRITIARIDPGQPILVSATMRELIRDSIADRQFILTLLAVTGCLALVLAAGGLYGVVSYLAIRKTREMGIRMALGAAPRQVLALVFREGMAMAGIGAASGLFFALIATRLLRGQLTGLAAADPFWIAAAVILVISTATLACLLPALRATQIDPISALRQG